MPIFEIAEQDGLHYAHEAPTASTGRTFVFFNALTGDSGLWEAEIGPRLRAAGHGTLTFNYRGQEGSPFGDPDSLGPEAIVADAGRLIAATAPARPVLVGLSIGGLFAARAWLAGAPAEGLVLVNTLRRDGPRLRWIGDALVRAAEVGGLELLRDLYVPLLFNEAWLAENRDAFLGEAPYRPIDRDGGPYNLLRLGGTADWDLPYERLTLPVLIVTGLQDRMFLDPADVEALAARIPSARRVDMADAAHMLPAERPAALVEALLDFVGEA